VSVGQEDGVVELDETYDTSQMFRTASLQKQAKKTIALDIDGVLAQYDGVYTNTIGTPVVGSQAFIQQLVDAGFKVVIYSSRPAEAIYAWLNQHQFPSLEIAAAKPMASMFVDDRALMFRGDFPTIFREIQEFHPWWEEEAQ
jgi:predicted HAD superfamily phosphohydrolase YqeG